MNKHPKKRVKIKPEPGEGQRLKRLRVYKGLTQREVADLLGVAEGTYRLWEREKVRIPDPRIQKVEELMGGGRGCIRQVDGQVWTPYKCGVYITDYIDAPYKVTEIIPGKMILIVSSDIETTFEVKMNESM